MAINSIFEFICYFLHFCHESQSFDLQLFTTMLSLNQFLLEFSRLRKKSIRSLFMIWSQFLTLWKIYCHNSPTFQFFFALKTPVTDASSITPKMYVIIYVIGNLFKFPHCATSISFSFLQRGCISVG